MSKQMKKLGRKGKEAKSKPSPLTGDDRANEILKAVNNLGEIVKGVDSRITSLEKRQGRLEADLHKENNGEERQVLMTRTPRTAVSSPAQMAHETDEEETPKKPGRPEKNYPELGDIVETLGGFPEKYKGVLPANLRHALRAIGETFTQLDSEYEGVGEAASEIYAEKYAALQDGSFSSEEDEEE